MLTINVTNWKLMTIFFFERKMHRGLGLILTFRKDMLAVVSINHECLQVPNYRNFEGENSRRHREYRLFHQRVW